MKYDEPIKGIENRSPQEVFDIMVSRFRAQPEKPMGAVRQILTQIFLGWRMSKEYRRD